MKQFLTYGILDYQCMKQAGDISDNDINSDTRQAYINTKLMKIYQMLDGLNDPFYNRKTILTAAADQELLKDTTNNAGTYGIITAINATASTITRSSGVFTAGSLIIVTLTPVDATGGKISYQWIARIVTGGATATYLLISGSALTLTSAYGASVVVIKTQSTTSCDVSGIYFQRFVNITDPEYTTVSGAKIRVFDRKEDSQLFLNMDKDQLSTKRVWWYHSGDTIYIGKGSAANALGVITAEYRGKPAIYTDATIDNTIDLPPEFNQMLVDETVASYLIDRGKVVPDDINGRMANYAKAYEAAAAARAKAMEIQNK
jgi:hypothetical protein